jgi:alanine dehydrogenase
MPTLILTRTDVAQLLELADCLVAVEQAFREYALGTAIPPRVLGVHVDEGAFHIKAGGVRSPTPYFATKVNANFTHNRERFGLPTIQGVIVLADLRDGRPLAIMDSSVITELRTGAATGLAASWLTPARPMVVTLIGCGQQGRIQLRSVALVRRITEVFACDVDIDAAERLAADMGGGAVIDAPIHIVRNRSDRHRALAASDIVITCTTSRQPVLFKGEIGPAAFVAAVGADNPEKQEIDPELLTSAIVVADVLDQSVSIGDVRHAIAAGLMRREDVWAELGDVVIGRKRLAGDGDGDRDRSVIFDSTGMALQDVTVAALVYERAKQTGVGVRLPLSD